MKVVLISGKAGHGKDTAAQLMKNELEARGEKVLIIKFGDAVKWFAREYYGYTGTKNIEERTLLQYIGTEMMRTYDKYYWGRIVSEFIAANKDFTYALIPDWRFYSEKEIILADNKKCYTIRIERPNFINPNMTKAQLKHVSETELDNYKFDWIIRNEGSIEDLREKVKIVLDNLE